MATLLCGGLVVVPAASAATVRLTSPERQVLKLVNAQRTKRGLKALRANVSLTRAARWHSRAMASTPFFSHISRDGRTPGQRARAKGYTIRGYRRWQVGENIAWGTAAFASPQATVRAWMKSPSHRRLILTKAFRDVGIGRAVGSFAAGDTVLQDVTYFTLDLGVRSK